MCFSTKKLVLKQAKRNKVFYKVLEQINIPYNYKIYKYQTPYRAMEVNLGKWYSSDSATVEFCNADMTVGSGVFHLFKNRKSAESLAESSNNRCIVVKAIVPKGAFYAIDHDEVITSDVRYEKLASKKTFKFWKR